MIREIRVTLVDGKSFTVVAGRNGVSEIEIGSRGEIMIRRGRTISVWPECSVCWYDIVV